MDDEGMKKIMETSKTIAVVGISFKTNRPSHRVASYLQSKGYRTIPVRPDGEHLLGEQVYPTLNDIPPEITIDVVDIFRKSEDVPPIVKEAIHRGAKVIWMQEGVSHPEAAAQAEQAGLQVVMDRCIMKEHARLLKTP